MQLHWHDNPLYRFAPRADLCADPTLRRNIARLADYGWSFDLQVFGNNQLGGDTDMLGQTRSGALEMCLMPDVILGTLIPVA